MRRESRSAQPGEVAPPPASATLIELLSRNALQMPRVVALREKDLGIWQEYTWRQYLDEVLALASGLDALGFTEGDALIVLGDNRPRLYFGLLAASTLRGVPVPVFPDAIADEVRHIVGSCQPRFLRSASSSIW